MSDKKFDIPEQFDSPAVPTLLTEDSVIQFRCYKGISCFNACCRHADVTLAPYDVLRLQKRLGMSSEEFLKAHTVPFQLDADGVPGIKMRTDDEGACLFLDGENGCGVYAEVQNGVWTGQEPAFDHPFNRGAHCAKGAAVREHGHGERRLKYPTKLVDGKWTKVSWEQAINEVGDQMQQIREQSGPDSVYWLGSAKHNKNRPICFVSLPHSGAPTTSITRPASVIQPPWPV